MNQYQTPQSTQYGAIGSLPTPRKVQVQPIELLKQAMNLMGNEYWLYVGITFVGLLIAGAVPMAILQGPMFVGFFLCFMQRHSGQRTDFATLFKGFDYFADSLIATLIMVGIIFVISLPVILFLVVGIIVAGAAGSAAGDAGAMVAGLGMFAGVLLIFFAMTVLYLPFLFMYQLIAGHGLAAWPAVQASFAGAKANFGGLILLMIVFGLLTTVAACLCVFPVYLLFPVQVGAMYVLYTQIFPRQAKPMPY